MDSVLVVGSGASGVHFALTVLRKGYRVTMLDAGGNKPKAFKPGESFNDLKSNLDDPARFFLGENYEAVVSPGDQKEYYTKYYGFPPSKRNVFSRPAAFDLKSKGFEPLISFAQGGLAEAWTAGVYPLNDHELSDFPFKYCDIEPHYSEVARRIGINGAEDDLARFYPSHKNLSKPLEMDLHSKRLIAAYQSNRGSVNKLDCYMGRSRVATLSSNRGDRKGCTYCGRCLWGCATESLYTPSITLKECQQYDSFKYVPNMLVDHFDYDAEGRVTRCLAQSTVDQSRHEFAADRVVLAGGTLSSTKIFMTSVFKTTGEKLRLPGLMDNRQVLIPFINLKMLGQPYNPESYQYHQLAIGFQPEDPREYVHGQISTLKSALVHPIIQNMPFNLKMSTFMFKNLRAGMGIVNLNFCDWRRENNYLSLETAAGNESPRLTINYSPPDTESALIKETLRKVKKVMWKLGCVVPSGTVHVRPMGSSVHYTGTIPMSRVPAPYTVSKDCRSHDFSNLYFVDGTTFPFLPAKNVTFSLMANAVRVGETAF